MIQNCHCIGDFDRSTVMPGLVPGIHVFPKALDVDGRVKPGHDDLAHGSRFFAGG
jgi:hypothetical protein